MRAFKQLVHVGAVLVGSVVALCGAPSLAASWPQRPVKFILTLGPGSGTDISARLLADRLAPRWGQPVVVENRPGGDGMVAILAVIGAADDHVLLYGPTSSFTAHPYQHDKLPYDPRDLVPIARVSNTVVVVAVPAALGVNSVADLLARVRSEPDRLNFNTATGVTDFAIDGFLRTAGLSMTRVPYRDTVQALNDLGEGRLQMWIGALAIARPHVEAGRVKLIAITNSARASVVPDIPTVTEAGYPAWTFDGLVGLLGPREMTEDVRKRIAADIAAVAADPEIVARLGTTGQVVSPGSPSEFAASIEAQRASVAATARALGIKPSQ
jgi:tripartite-type tricarboxylate transporter receptor subunit TctC